MFLLHYSCCYQSLRVRAALELMGPPLGCFSSQMGTARGHPPPRAGVTPLPSTSQLLAPFSAPSCQVCSATAGAIQSIAPCSHQTEGKVIVRAQNMGWPTVMGTVRPNSALSELTMTSGGIAQLISPQQVPPQRPTVGLAFNTVV